MWGFTLTLTLVIFSELCMRKCNFRKYGDSTKLEGGVGMFNGKDLRRMQMILRFEKVQQRGRNSAGWSPASVDLTAWKATLWERTQGCDGHHMECTSQNDTQGTRQAAHLAPSAVVCGQQIKGNLCSRLFSTGHGAEDSPAEEGFWWTGEAPELRPQGGQRLWGEAGTYGLSLFDVVVASGWSPSRPQLV